MYKINNSLTLNFAHFIYGRQGPEINIHGHTWKFNLTIETESRTPPNLNLWLLNPVHQLLDHAFCVPKLTIERARPHLKELGFLIMSTRNKEDQAFSDDGSALGYPHRPHNVGEFGGAWGEICGGMKVAVLPGDLSPAYFADWYFRVAAFQLQEEKVKVISTSVQESHDGEEIVAYRSDQ